MIVKTKINRTTFIKNPSTVTIWIRLGRMLDIWLNEVSILFLELAIRKFSHGSWGLLVLLLRAIINLMFFSLVTDILTEIVSVNVIIINSAIFRKIKVNGLHTINIMIISRKYCELECYSINCGNNLNGKTIKCFFVDGL